MHISCEECSKQTYPEDIIKIYHKGIKLVCDACWERIRAPITPELTEYGKSLQKSDPGFHVAKIPSKAWLVRDRNSR